MHADRLLTAACAISIASTLHAQTHVYVDDDAPSGGDGLSWQTALNDLHDAIDLANTLGQNRGEIRIAGGTYLTSGVPFQVQLVRQGDVPVHLHGGYAGLSVPAAPDTRDPDVYESILESEGKGNTLELGSGPDTSAGYVNQVSATTLDGLRFRGMTSACVINTIRFRSVNIQNCDFVSVQSSSAGAVFLKDLRASIDGCRFESNTSSTSRGGGAITVDDGEVRITNSDFYSNERVNDPGGAISMIDGDHVIRDCGFYGNSAYTGGAIYLDAKSAEIAGCEFFDNDATHTDFGQGGAVNLTVNGTLSATSITECNFIGNTAAKGGAVYLRDHSASNTLIVATSTFLQNESKLGGAVYQDPESTPIQITLCDLADNSANNGGAVWGAADINDSTFARNTAADSGGAVDGRGFSKITGCEFVDCTAGDDGGAVYNASEVVLSQFTGNSAGVYGGAIASVPLIHRVIATHNQAFRGGGVYDVVEVNDCDINDNIGGGVYGDVRLVHSSQISRNTLQPGLAYRYGTNFNEPVEVINSIIMGNEYEGATFEASTDGTPFRIERCLIADNGREGLRFHTGQVASRIIIDIYKSQIQGNRRDAVRHEPLPPATGHLLRVVDSLIQSPGHSAISVTRETDVVVAGLTAISHGPQGTIVAGEDSTLLIESSIVLQDGGADAIQMQGAELVLIQSLVSGAIDGVSVSPLTSTKLVGDIFDADPGFVSFAGSDNDPLTWQDNDYRLDPGSAAIDNGTTLSVNEGRISDLDARPRIRDDAGMPNDGFGINRIIDLGAYEFQGTTCTPDINNDGLVSPADFSAWIAAYNSLSRRADQNFDGLVAPSDFTAWLANYNKGCP